MISTDSLCLRVAQMPRSRHLAIFVLTDTQTDGQNRLLYPLLSGVKIYRSAGNQCGTIICQVLQINYLPGELDPPWCS